MSGEGPSTSQHAGDESIQVGRDLVINVDGSQLEVMAEPPSPDRRIRFGLPPKPDRLEGRQDELDILADRLLRDDGGETSIVPNTLHGMGGIGKTALSLWFAYNHINDFSLIWWIDAENPESIPGQYIQFARAMGYGQDITADNARNAVAEQLDARDTWLLIFDNAQSRSDISPFVPTLGKGSVLVTSRNPAGWRSPIQLELLEHEDVVAWLLDAVGSNDRGAAIDLAVLLDRLPLAVTQAAGYCDTNGTPLSTYRDLFETEQRRMLTSDIGRLDDRGTVDTTFGLSIDKLKETDRGSAAVVLLELCSYLAPDRIPLDIFTPESLGVQTAAGVEEAVGQLRRYSLITRDSGDLLYVHRLVQAIARHRIEVNA